MSILSNLNYITEIAVAVFTLIGMLGAAIVYLVIRDYKTRQLCKDVEELKKLPQKVSALEGDREDLLSTIRETQLHYREIQASHSLIFEGILGIANKVGADEVVVMIKKKTMVVAKTEA